MFTFEGYSNTFMLKSIVWLLLVIISCGTNAQRHDASLQKKITTLITGYKGDVGIFIKDLRNGKTVDINADSLFPTASLVKVSILMGVMDKIERGELNYHQELIYHDSILYPGVDILGSFRNGEKIELSKLMMLMMTMSDNTASLWLQMLGGTGIRINQLLGSTGLKYTRVNSKTPGREADREKYGWGQTTPREMASLIEKIYRGQIISAAASNHMLRLMNRNYWDGQALSQLPPTAAMFSKNGALNEYRSEVVLVRGMKSLYTFCVITNNNPDTSWTKDNEASQLIRKISGTIWNHYEPSYKWTPPAGADKFY
jgi:beta-lactamase class A